MKHANNIDNFASTAKTSRPRIGRHITSSRIALSALVVIILIGATLRVLCCFWGLPLALHADEHSIVDPAMEMLSRHSWEALEYHRPDQFEIKLDSIIFSLFSFIAFQQPAYTAFESHPDSFLLVARLVTAAFGTLCIPLTFILAGKLANRQPGTNRAFCQVLSAIFVSASPILVKNSAYATPDVVLCFIILLFTLVCMRFYKEGSIPSLIAACSLLAIACCIKYPSVILAVALAATVIIHAVRQRLGYRTILKRAVFSLAITCGVVFVIAPNLITDFGSVLQAVHNESRTNHAGADGLGVLGNFGFYFFTAADELTKISIVFFAIGLVNALRNRISPVPLIICISFWVCISIPALHWERWGIPIYPFYFIAVSSGLSSLLNLRIQRLRTARTIRIVLTSCVCLISFLISLNLFLSSCCVAKYSLSPDTRSIALDWCEENGITPENSIPDAYTPFQPNNSVSSISEIEVIDGMPRISSDSDYAGREYFIMSSSLLNRYEKEPEKYASQLSSYYAVMNNSELIWEKSGGGYPQSSSLIQGIERSLQYLIAPISPVGNNIYIYKL